MIKKRFLFLIVCMFFASASYSRTEVKPPAGPFKSLLRETFKLDLPELDEDKQYNFQVPDLGRYQERSPDSSLDIISREPVSKGTANPDTLWFDTQSYRKEQNISFDPNAFIPDANNPVPPRTNSHMEMPPVMSFDSMPIGYGQVSDVDSYPPEWANSLPFNSVNPVPKQNNQNQPMMGMPFPSPSRMPMWPLNNYSNSGYQ